MRLLRKSPKTWQGEAPWRGVIAAIYFLRREGAELAAALLLADLDRYLKT